MTEHTFVVTVGDRTVTGRYWPDDLLGNAKPAEFVRGFLLEYMGGDITGIYTTSYDHTAGTYVTRTGQTVHEGTVVIVGSTVNVHDLRLTCEALADYFDQESVGLIVHEDTNTLVYSRKDIDQ